MTLFVFIQDRESLLFKKYFIWIIGVLSSVMVGEALLNLHWANYRSGIICRSELRVLSTIDRNCDGVGHGR